jgi:3-oxoacyl-[acyl-carrier protein] reductase
MLFRHPAADLAATRRIESIGGQTPMARLSRLERTIAGKVALITGAASGMGRATAHLFADEGARVAVIDRDADGARRVAQEIASAGGVAHAWDLDVSDETRIAATVASVVDRYGGLGILINNAGVSGRVSVEAEGYGALWARTFAINLTAQVNVIRACLPHLLRSGGGRIVNIASTEGLGATAGISPYTASKHGVIGLTRSLAVELGRRGVTVNCICPGPIHTGITASIPEEAKTKFARRRVPLGRYGDPEEVAHMTLSLVLPAASYLNGAVVVVDGGMLAQNT